MKSWLLLVVLLTPVAQAEPPLRVKNLKVLAVLYRGAPDQTPRLSDHEVQQAQNGLELGRLFYFRNSLARLNVEFDWRIIDAPAPPNDGPTMEHMEADLRTRGVTDGTYDGLVVSGVGLKGNWGGFNVLGGAGGCFGIGGFAGTGYPAFDPDTGYGWAWIFAHEFQHALDLVIVEGSNLDMLHSHPYADHNEAFFKGYYQGGEHWDWVAVTLREFDDWLQLKGVTNSFLEVTDADGDGLPDADPRLPADEQRFGSDPTRKDTDGDGLSDRDEFTADRYFGSDPRAADTDGDGLRDAEDPYPVVALRPTLPYLHTDAQDPHGGAALLLDTVIARNDAGGDCSVWAGWREDGLHLWFLGPRKFSVALKLDGSAANGFWEGGDTYVFQIADGELTFDGLGLKGAPAGASAKAVPPHAGEGYVLEAFLPAALGQGVSKEINYGGKRAPQDVATGLTLVPGRSISFNVAYQFEDQTRALLTPNHAMYATRLIKPAAAPAHVLLRGPALTNVRPPRVEVLGVGALARVHVTSPDEPAKILGARVGPGPVQLVGVTRDGVYELVARAAGQASAALRVTVDSTAAPPELALQPQAAAPARDIPPQAVLTARTEPNAQFELWWGIDGTPVAPLTGAAADASGAVTLPLAADFLAGWTAIAYDGSEFQRQVFVAAWPEIDRNFEAGAPDPRLGADAFSFRFDGLLSLETAGQYTFELNTDDGSRLYLDDEMVLNHWGQHGMQPRTARVHLEPGLHRVRIDYQERDGWAGVKFRYAPPGGPLTTKVPVQRAPLALSALELYGVQVDALGNRSGFSQPVIPRE